MEKKTSLIISTVVGEIIIFVLCGVIFFYKNFNKNKITLLLTFLLFIHLQINLLGILYTHYYELKNDVSDYVNGNFNRQGLWYFLYIIIPLIFIQLLINLRLIRLTSEPNKPLLIFNIVLYIVTNILLFFYIKSYKNFIDER